MMKVLEGINVNIVIDHGLSALGATHDVILSGVAMALWPLLVDLSSIEFVAFMVAVCFMIIVVEKIFTRRGLLVAFATVELVAGYAVVSFLVETFGISTGAFRTAVVLPICFMMGLFTPKVLAEPSFVQPARRSAEKRSKRRRD